MNIDIQNLKKIVGDALDIAILIKGNPSHDSVGSALALKLALSDIGKKVFVACPSQMIIDHANYIGAQDVSGSFGVQNFVISLDYTEGSVEKVSYHIKNGKFNIVIEPRGNQKIFNESMVSYSYDAKQIDLIITIDAPQLEDFDFLYKSNLDIFRSIPIINVDCHDDNMNYGTINIIDSQSASTAEIVSQFIGSLGIKMSQDIGTNLLNAIYNQTENFKSQKVNSRTFDLAALCIKSGAKRFQISDHSQISADTKKVAADLNLDKPKDLKQNTTKIEAFSTAPNYSDSNTQKNISDISEKMDQKSDFTATPPEDWFKPKIFRTSHQE